MAALAFVPHNEPQSDFLITVEDSRRTRELMLSLGATVTERSGYTAYVWNGRLGERFMLGLGVLDGRFSIGPMRLRELPSRLGAGNYTIIDLAQHRASVWPDPFGMNAVYHSETLVTNRLHLAGIVSRATDISNALSSTYNDGGFSFSFNTFKTPIEGVSLLPAGAKIEVSAGKLRSVEADVKEQFETCDPQDYWALINRGASEVVENVIAVVDSGLPVFCDITGGRDSRVVFGALVAAGRQNDVIFNTISNPSSAELQADLDIGTGLVSLYGGSYSGRPRAIGYAEYSTAQNLDRRRSQIFGAYHWILPSDVRPVAPLTKAHSVRMLGGGGELYREYWKPLLFTSVDCDVLSTDELVHSMLARHRGGALSARHFERYIQDLLATFRVLPGDSIGHKLDAHYLNFRNRFHFGPRQSSPESMSTINVATSPSLLAASRALPARERATGRVLFDVIRTFDERLAYLPFDKPGDANLYTSPYHVPSKFDGEAMLLEPAAHLVHTEDRRNFLRPRVPVAPPWSFEEVLDSEIGEALEVLSDPASSFSFIVDSDLMSNIRWAKAHSPRNRSSLASKLRAFADFSQL